MKTESFVKRFLVFTVLLVFVSITVFAAGAKEPAAKAADDKLVIAYAPPTYDMSDWWGKFGTNLKTELEKRGVEYELFVRAPETHASHQQQYGIIQDFINLEPDFILMGPTELYAQMGAYENINDAGIPLIILNYTEPFAEDEGVDILSWVGYSHKYGGELAGEWIVNWFKENKGGKGEMAVLFGNPGSLTEDRYSKTTLPMIQKEVPGVKVVYEGGAEYDRVKAYNATQNILTGFPEVDLIYAINSAMAVGSLEAVKDAGRDDIPVIGWGGVDEEVELVWAGELASCVFRGEYSTAEVVADIFEDYKAGRPVKEVNVTAMAMIDSRESILEHVEEYRLKGMGLID
jgi:ABC-type sugar transport system substrate-binding protein